MADVLEINLSLIEFKLSFNITGVITIALRAGSRRWRSSPRVTGVMFKTWRRKINLPSEKQKELLGALIQYAFVEIRIIGSEGKGKQASDLAGAFHNVSREMYGWGSWNPETFRGMLEDYQSRYHGEDYVGKFDYVRRFNEIYPKT